METSPLPADPSASLTRPSAPPRGGADSTAPSSASVWQRHARRTARRLNLAWWLQFSAPWAAGLSLVVLGVILWLRSRGTELPTAPTAAVIGGLYLIAGFIAWLVARKNFQPTDGSLVLLESHLKLNNALTAARQGITAWPAAPASLDDGFRFRAPWLVAPLLLTVSCLTLAFFLPITRAVGPPTLPPPLAMERAADLLSAIRKEDVASPEALAKAEEQLQTLLAQPPGDYYSHHSLEAADALETSLRAAAGKLGAQLQTAAQAAGSLEKFDSALSPDARKQLEGDLQSALQGLQNSSMGTSSALKEQLAKLDPSKLKELDPEQMKKMLENLQAKAKACKNCQGGQCAGQSEAEKALSDLLNKKGEKSGFPGDGMGRGGVERGPGTGDLTFEKDASQLDTNNLEQLTSQDLSRTLPGDHMGTKDIEHNLDQSPSTGSNGGAAAAAQGGDAVQREQLLPSEQKVLRRYFK
ncbi:MAG: hypothetical protein JWL81_125 [Verrucomicrobiales bacterium]|nr:hypothetical protein [Verrucomicrobiales bacterium]